MSKQPNVYECKIFEVIREYDTKFYYQRISLSIEEEYKIVIEKDKEEMVGYAAVTLPDGKKTEYEIRYNRIVNLNEGYTLLVSGEKR